MGTCTTGDSEIFSIRITLLIRRCLPGRAAGSEGNDDARDFDRSEFWMLDGYPACLPPSYSEAMRDYPIFDGVLADNVGQMSTMV